MTRGRKNQQVQQQSHVEDNFAHDPALIEASNSAAAAVIQAAVGAASFVNNGGGGGGANDNRLNVVDHHHHSHHGLDSSMVHGTLSSNLDPAVVGMGLSTGHHDGSGGSGGGHVHHHPASTAEDAATKAAVAVAAAAAAAVANANVNMNPDGNLLDMDDSSMIVDESEEKDSKGRVKRTAITHEQRKALREWFFSQDPRPSQAKSIIWFHDRFERVISQAAISHSLHDRYKHLDFSVGAPSSTFRQRSAQWPELEAVLFDYLQAIEKKKGKSAFPSVVSGDILTKAAKTVWQQIPMYANQNPPTFSNGWVSRFKGRYKTYKQYGDATAVDIRAIQQLTSNFQADSIYTMDETSLYWRRPPTITATARDKSKITLVLCTNATGTDKLPLWSIGRSKEYRSLANVNLSAIDSHWRSNENAWLTGSIMEEWLQAFYEHVGSRPVLLVMDNFSAHIQGLAECPPPSNVRVQFLPTNCVAIFQPLDKGVVDQFKIYYRKHWLDYMVQCHEKRQNPLDVVTMREALRWAVKAWDHDIQPESITYAFHEASVLPSLPKQQNRQKQMNQMNAPPSSSLILPPPSSSPTSLLNNNSSSNSNNNNNVHHPTSSAQLYSPQLLIEPSYVQVWETQQFNDMIDLESFINFSNEESVGVEDVAESEVLQAIINYHLGLSQLDEDELDNNSTKIDPGVNVDTDPLLPSASQVLNYLEVVMNFVERQPYTTRSQMRALEEIELELERRQ